MNHGKAKALVAAALLFAWSASVMGTTIQLSPMVGHRGNGLYRAASYNRAVDQYSRQAEEDYTVRFGNLRLQISLGLEAVYDDNSTLADSDEEDALSLSPVIYSEIYWPLNPGFQVYSGLSLGYRWYAIGEDEQEDEGFYVGGTDGALHSQLGFDLRIGQNGLLSASAEYFRDLDTFEGGNRGDRDYTLNRALFNVQYRNDFTDYTNGTAKFTHTNQWVEQSEFEAQDHFSDFLDLALLHFLNRDLQLGPYGRGGIIRYTEDLHNDADEIEGGIALVYGTTERLVTSGSVGYSRVSFDTANNPEATDEYSGWTTQWAVRYSNNEVTTHRVTTSYGAEQGNLSAAVNFAKEWATQYTISVMLREDLLVNGDLGYINVRESDDGDNYNVYRLGVGLGYRLTRDTTADLRYIRDWRESDDRDGADYTRNAIILRLVHRL
jgi:hypothetical protein